MNYRHTAPKESDVSQKVFNVKIRMLLPRFILTNVITFLKKVPKLFHFFLHIFECNYILLIVEFL